MPTTDKKEELFPAIGKVADQADQVVADEEKPVTAAEDDEKVVTEIESLCMNCHEKVGFIYMRFVRIRGLRQRLVGNHEIAFDFYSVLQGNRRDVLQVRTLRDTEQ